MAIADLNRDGTPDIAVANANASTATVFFGDGTGAFSAPTPYDADGASATANPAAVIARDVTGDGKLDLVVANMAGGRVTVLKAGACQ